MSKFFERRRPLVALSGAIVVAILLVACSGPEAGETDNSPKESITFGSIPAETGSPQEGGTVDIAQPAGAGPYYVLPIVPAAFNSTYVISSFQNLMFRPLFWTSEGGTAKIDDSLSVAEPPVYSEDNTKVTIRIKEDFTWADGTPVGADDLVFSLDLIKAAVAASPANWANYTPGRIPDSITDIKVTSDKELTLTLDQAYNPEWFTHNQLSLITPLPAHAWAKTSADGAIVDFRDPSNAAAIYAYLDQAAKTPSGFATDPLWQTVNGPYRLSAFDATTNAYSMVPNDEYTGGQKSHVEQVNFQPFTSESAAFNQLLSGELTAGRIEPSNLSQIKALEAAGYNLYGGPQSGFNFIMLNHHDTTGNVDKLYAQPYIRQMLQHLVNQPGFIASKGVFNGAAVQSYTALPVNSPFLTDELRTPPFPYDPQAAQKLLEDHGWKVVPDGKTVCERPGTGDKECGEGIPKGQTLSFELFYRSGPAVPEAIATAFSSEARKLGIDIPIGSKTFSFLIQNYNIPAAPSKADEWAMTTWGGFNGLGAYPTTAETFGSTGSSNVGGFSDPKLDELIHESIYGSDPEALTKEMAYLQETLPVLWLPTAQTIWAWKTDLSGPENAFANLPASVLTPEYWYFSK